MAEWIILAKAKIRLSFMKQQVEKTKRKRALQVEIQYTDNTSPIDTYLVIITHIKDTTEWDIEDN